MVGCLTKSYLEKANLRHSVDMGLEKSRHTTKTVVVASVLTEIRTAQLPNSSQNVTALANVLGQTN